MGIVVRGRVSPQHYPPARGGCWPDRVAVQARCLMGCHPFRLTVAACAWERLSSLCGEGGRHRAAASAGTHGGCWRRRGTCFAEADVVLRDASRTVASATIGSCAEEDGDARLRAAAPAACCGPPVFRTVRRDRLRRRGLARPPPFFFSMVPPSEAPARVVAVRVGPHFVTRGKLG